MAALGRAAILFFSHKFDAGAVAHLAKLKRECAPYGSFFVYADERGEPFRDAEDPGDVVRFDFEAVRRRYPRIFGDSLVPGNCHLTLLDFFKRNPGFDHYWVIEYDVVFTGDWGELFAAFAGDDADFLATHIRTLGAAPDWYYWGSLQPPNGEALPATLIRAFCPVQRVSRRALEFLEAKAQQGWSGHFEMLVPTLLLNGGFRVADIGGDGAYVAEGFRNRFYTSFSWADGSLEHLGTMRHRPAVASLRFARRHRLYHPVKHDAEREPARLGRLVMKERLSYLAHQLKNHPRDFSRALARLYLS